MARARYQGDAADGVVSRGAPRRRFETASPSAGPVDVSACTSPRSGRHCRRTSGFRIAQGHPHPDAVIDTQNGIPFFSKTVAGAPVTLLVHHCHRRTVGRWQASSSAGSAGGSNRDCHRATHRRSQYLTVSASPQRKNWWTSVSSANELPWCVTVPIGSPSASTRGGSITRAERPSHARFSQRLVPHKQIEDALEAVAALAGRRFRTSISTSSVVVGGSRTCANRAAELGIGDAVSFYGHVDEARKHELLAQSWIHHSCLRGRKGGAWRSSRLRSTVFRRSVTAVRRV